MQEFKYVGHPVKRVDILEKVTGAAQYVDDIDFGPNLLYAQLVESPHAHALITKIDTSEAEKVPGVVKVVTGKDLPYYFGLYMQDRHIFAQKKVRFVGEQVAAVIARDPKTSQKAAELVKVDYEPLPAIFDPVEAIQCTTPRVTGWNGTESRVHLALAFLGLFFSCLSFAFVWVFSGVFAFFS